MRKKKRTGRKIFLAVLLLAAIAVPAYILTNNYLDSRPKLDYIYSADSSPKAQYPNVNFAVISDLHYYDHSLGIDGSAFESVMLSDRKLLPESGELLNFAINELLDSGVDFVLIPGDITKDGERINHDKAAAELKKLTDAGIKVFVVPGNHDVNNPLSEGYNGDSTYPVETVQNTDFAEIYAEMGYGRAISRDKDSLSYITEAAPGLLILGLDFCRHDENEPDHHAVTGGRLKESTMRWIAEVLTNAHKSGAAVIALSHHGVVEHWDGQRKLHPQYLVEDYKHIGKMLASYNVRAVFTGHYHAQDITRADFGDGGYIYDIETGSLVTHPCPIRYCELNNGSLAINSDKIIYRLRPGTSFADDAEAFVKKTVYLEAFSTLKKFKVSDKDSEIIANAVGDGFVAHYYGDEDPSKNPGLDKSRLGLWGRVVLMVQQYVLDGLWADLPPNDNDVTLDLR
ncbi:MAG: metallophosphoesterase [Oscillospiraceae bacterium]|nr:metallophosphoesterase [Oscillospiraceae bacterium]